MKTLAFCAASFAESVRRAAGVKPLTSPPVLLDTFDPAQLEGYDFYYIKLHGLHEEPYWYGDLWQTACSREQIGAVDWSGATVFVANCHGVRPDGRPDVMAQAILDAGARALVAGSGENYASADALTGCDLLGAYFLNMMRIRFRPDKAFSLAMSAFRTVYPDRRVQRMPAAERRGIEDALGFRVFVGRM